jgi:hypothetical protein
MGFIGIKEEQQHFKINLEDVLALEERKLSGSGIKLSDYDWRQSNEDNPGAGPVFQIGVRPELSAGEGQIGHFPETHMWGESQGANTPL